MPAATSRRERFDRTVVAVAEELEQRWARQLGPVEFAVEMSGELPPAVGLSTFRVVQEALDAAARTPRDQLDRMGAAARTRALSRHDIATEAAKLAALFAATRNR